ncbi:MAG: hypothetical protein AAB261_08745 [Chloroflexota bacterium]
MDDPLLQRYNSIVNGCGLVDTSAKARLWSSGRDRIDLIHRMSTNDLRDMALHEGRATILTNALARMIDRVVVINLKDRALILGSWGAATRIRKWLSGYIFFNDEIKLEDASPQWGQFDLVGPGAAAIADSLIGGASGLKKFSVIQSDEAIIGRGDAVKGDSFFAVAASEQLAQLRQQATASGAVACDRDLYDLLRIESGIPEIDHEISDEYIPLEANLWGDVSFSKGCYIGQEIIARMESRGKLAKMLVGVESASPLMAGTKIEGGVITSVAESPRGGWIGLAYLKSPQAQAGTEIHHDDLVMRVASLPFAS